MDLKKLTMLAGFGFSLLSISTLLIADDRHSHPQRYLYAGGHIGWNFLDIGRHYDEITTKKEGFFLPGLQAGYRFSENWSLNGTWEYTKDSTELFGDDDVNTSVFTGVLRHHFDYSGFEPYVGLGAGQYRTEYRDSHNGSEYPETIAALEGGIQKWLGSSFFVDVGARPYYSLRTERWDTIVYAGLNVAFGLGGSERPKQGDDDKDGVLNGVDACPDTPEGALVDKKGCQLYLDSDIRETLYVEFDLDKANVRSASYPLLRNLAQKMREYPSSNLELEGHTDSTGSAGYNLNLSVKRAEAVKSVFIDHFHIDESRISAKGLGESQPNANNGTSEGRAKNRRVEATLRATKKSPLFSSE